MKIQQKLAIGFIKTKIKLLSLINNRKAAEAAFEIFCTPLKKSTVKDNGIFKDAERLTFRMHDKWVQGYRFNHPGKKIILLLHGFSSSSRNFSNYVKPLLDKNYEVIAFDAPAHGNSEGKTINALEYAEMILKVNKIYGPVNGYIAHSFGGIAVCLAMENITHFADTKIALIAPATETKSAIDGAFSLLGLINKQVRSLFDELIYEKSGHHTSWFSIRRALFNINATVLWFHDEDDDVTPLSDALKVKEDNHPNVKFVITKGLGHRKIYRDETVLNAVADFM